MKKRIISMILVAVMALLTLASCGFNYSNEKMDKYASFDSSKFTSEIANLKIEDGEFSQADAAKRADMVMDAIWAAIAAKAETDKKLVGKADDPETEENEADEAIGEHDLVFYSYYVTATVGDKTYMLFTKNMKESTGKVQLGQKVFTEDQAFDEKVLNAIKDYTFTADSAYDVETSGTIAEDQWVYVSYERTWKKTEGENTVTYTEIVTDERMQVGKGDEANFTKLLAGKSAGSSEITGISEVTIGDITYTYSKIKVSAIEKSGTEFTFTHTLYEKDDYKDGKKEDVTRHTKKGEEAVDKQIDLAGVELTYHVFPAYYAKVADYTAEVILNDVFGADVTIANIAKIVFGDEYIKLTGEDHDHSEDHDHEKELEDLYDKVMIKDKDGNEVDVNEFVKLLDTAMTEYKTAKEEYDKAYKALYGDGEDTKGALKELKNAYDAYQTAVKELADAKGAAETAKAAAEAAKAAYDAAVAAGAVTDEALEAALKVINDDATNKADLTKKENAVKEAEKKVTEATEKVTKAEADLAAAAEADKAAYESALTSAKAELEAANKALKEAQDALSATVIKKAEANKVDNKIAVLEAAKTTAEAAKTAADTTVETKTKNESSKKTTLNTERKDYASARKTLFGTYDYFTNEVEDADYATKIKAYEDALKAYEADKNDTNKAAVITAYKALITNTEDPAYNDEGAALKSTTGKDQTHTEKKEARDTLVKNFLDKMAEKSLDFKAQYEYYVQYKTLEDAYILEIKQAIAKEIYNKIFVPSVTIKETPKSEVDKVYEELIDNFQFFFYENYDLEKWLADGYTLTARDTKVKSYYDQYGASFERFLAEYAVKTAYGEDVENDPVQAKNAVRAKAAEIVKERVVIYTVAEGLGIKFTDETFKAYAKDEKGIEDIFQYDESVVENYRLALQTEKILDTVIGITKTLATEGEGYKANVITLNTAYFKDGKLPIKEEE